MYRSSTLALLGLLSVFISLSTAQTWTACNPTNRTDCPTDTALGMNYTFNFNDSSSTTTWNTTSGALKYGSNGGEFTINKRYDSPTIQSTFYIFFGIVEVHMKAATGQGIISSIVLESDDLDEVDWEFIGGNTTHVETNYFGKGNTTQDPQNPRDFYYPVAGPMDTFHNYTVHWTAEKLEWYIDTKLVRTLNYKDANGGNSYPQTPMNVRLGIWAGGDPSFPNGTIEWAGGLTDFTKGPYTMYVQSAKVTDFSSGSAYQYGDKSGTWQSIKSIAGNSTVSAQLTAAPSQTLADKWNNLSPTARIAIYASSGIAVAAVIGLITFCCIKKRRAGKEERENYNAKFEAERAEAAATQVELKGRNPDSLPSTATPSDYQGSLKGSYGESESSAPPTPVIPTNYRSNSNTSFNDRGFQQDRGYQNDRSFQNDRAFQDRGFNNGGFNSPRASPGAQPPLYYSNGFASSGFNQNGGYSPQPPQNYGRAHNGWDKI